MDYFEQIAADLQDAENEKIATIKKEQFEKLVNLGIILKSNSLSIKNALDIFYVAMNIPKRNIFDCKLTASEMAKEYIESYEQNKELSWDKK